MMRSNDTPLTLDLFADQAPTTPGQVEQIGQQAFVLRGFALPWLERLLPALESVLQAAPFRQMVTPGGFTMSVALSSCGALGWTTDRSGYRYTAHDPQTGHPWPDMPAVFRELAQAAARQAHFEHFEPDACLINRYVPGARMSLHQDKNERSSPPPSSRCPWACRRCSSSAASSAVTKACASRCSMATSWSGAAWTGCATTACCRSRKASTRAWVPSGST